MELMRILRRWRHVYGWRLRHWWFDKPGGRVARVAGALLTAVMLLAMTIVAGIEASRPHPEGQPHQAVIALVVWLIVALVVGLAIALSMNSPKQQVPDGTNSPTTDDGQSAVHVFGENWIDDSFLLAWRVVGRDPIKASGGK